MRRLALFVVVASLVLFGCQAEDPASAPFPVAVEPASPASRPVVEETAVEAEAATETPDASIKLRLSGPAGDLSDALSTGDSDRILLLIAILEEKGGSAAITAISTVIERSDDPEMKIEAIDSLAFLADEGDVSRGLQMALEDPSPDVRIEAADAIFELELTEVLPFLHTRSYQEPDPEVWEVIEDVIFELEAVDQDERG